MTKSSTLTSRTLSVSIVKETGHYGRYVVEVWDEMGHLWSGKSLTVDVRVSAPDLA